MLLDSVGRVSRWTSKVFLSGVLLNGLAYCGPLRSKIRQRRQPVALRVEVMHISAKGPSGQLLARPDIWLFSGVPKVILHSIGGFHNPRATGGYHRRVCSEQCSGCFLNCGLHSTLI